jgi:hypothetical protein
MIKYKHISATIPHIYTSMRSFISHAFNTRCMREKARSGHGFTFFYFLVDKVISKIIFTLSWSKGKSISYSHCLSNVLQIITSSNFREDEHFSFNPNSESAFVLVRCYKIQFYLATVCTLPVF